MDQPRGRAFYLLAAVFALYVLFLYGPTLTILALSFQGPSGSPSMPASPSGRAFGERASSSPWRSRA